MAKDFIVQGATPPGRVQPGEVRFGQYKYGPNGERIPNLRDGNAAALERRRQDEIARGGPMAQLHQRNDQSQPGAGAAMMGDTQGQQRRAGISPGQSIGNYATSGVIPSRPPNPSADVRPPMRAESRYTSTSTDPGVKSFAETFHPSNIFKGGGMDATGHFTDGGMTKRNEPRRIYGTPTGQQALDARFGQDWNQIRPEYYGYLNQGAMDAAARQAGLPNALALQRRNILQGNKTINQVGTVVDRGRVGNRGTALAGGGMLMDNTPGRGGGAVTGPMYAQADPVSAFRMAVARAGSAPQGAMPAAPVRSVAAPAPAVSPSVAEIFRPRVAAVDNAARSVIPVRNDTAPPLRNSADMPTQVRLKDGSTYTTTRRDAEALSRLRPEEAMLHERLIAFDRRNPGQYAKMTAYHRLADKSRIPAEDRPTYQEFVKAVGAPGNDLIQGAGRRLAGFLTRNASPADWIRSAAAKPFTIVDDSRPLVLRDQPKPVRIAGR